MGCRAADDRALSSQGAMFAGPTHDRPSSYFHALDYAPADVYGVKH